MKRVIDITDEVYEAYKKLDETCIVGEAIHIILKSTPLPEHYEERKTEWHLYPDEKPTVSKEYNITLKYHVDTTTAAYFTEDDTWYGSNDLYVPNACISAWAELPERYEEGEDDAKP